MFSVLVLLSTYNGEKYLREQLDSILNQHGVSVNILVRDDGSVDKTRQILSEYIEIYHNITYVFGKNIGFVKSFSELIRMSLSYIPTPEYLDFCDQDDIWFPNKLLAACMQLEKMDKRKPNLFSHNSIIIDEKGDKTTIYHRSPPRYTRGNVMVYSTEQGCCMVFNRVAVELYNQNLPTITWHDRWMYLICYYLGDVQYFQKPLISYRVHHENALAINKYKSSKAFPFKLFSFLPSLKLPQYTLHSDMAKEFLDNFGSKIQEKDKKLFFIFTTYKTSIISKFKFLASKEFLSPTGGMKNRIRQIIYVMIKKL